MQLPSQVSLKWCFSHTGLLSGYLDTQGFSNHRAFALAILSAWKTFFWQCTCFPGGSHNKESACNARNPGSIPGLGRSPGEGNSYPLQYSCLKNSMNRGAWQATVHGVAESDMTEWLIVSHPPTMLDSFSYPQVSAEMSPPLKDLPPIIPPKEGFSLDIVNIDLCSFKALITMLIIWLNYLLVPYYQYWMHMANLKWCKVFTKILT